jgi:hypothetical protein
MPGMVARPAGGLARGSTAGFATWRNQYVHPVERHMPDATPPRCAAMPGRSYREASGLARLAR